MLGVILCGGESSRMGTDKGLIRIESKTWALTAIEKMKELQTPVVVSVNDRQKEKYKQLIPGVKLISDSIVISIKGPVSGILSVHLQNPTEDLFVLACDMPLMETALLNDLYDYYTRNNTWQAYVYTIDGEREPLCSIYTAGGLESILKIYNEQRMVKHSMKFMLEQLAVFEIPVAGNKTGCFMNINNREGLHGLNSV